MISYLQFVLNKPKMAYSRDAFITEIRDRLERVQRGIQEGLERETRERQEGAIEILAREKRWSHSLWPNMD